MNPSAFRSSLAVGDAAFRDSENYEAYRRGLTWNLATPDRYPHAIAKPSTVAEVETAVRFAAGQGWEVSVKSGGHSHIGSSIRDGSLAVDVSALNSIEVDPGNRTAKVGPGATGRDLAVELARHGLAFPVGHCSSVALGGYLLGGGHGWNWNQWGPACHSVTGLDVVGQDGSVRTVNDENEPDLMWLARGCGPSFPGVVTAYYLDLHTLPVSVRTTLHVFPLDQLSAVTCWFDELSLAPSVEPALALCGPVFNSSAPEGDRYVVVFGMAYGEDDEATDVALRPLEEPPVRPVMSNVGTLTQFVDLFALSDSLLSPAGARLHADSVWSEASTHSILGSLQEHMKSSPSRAAHALCYPASVLPLRSDACFSMMSGYCTTIYGVHDTTEEDQRSTEWVMEGSRLLEPVTAGYWVGETDLTANPARAQKSFEPQVWERMREIRGRYDAGNLFADYLR